MTPCDDCGLYNCYACPTWQRQNYELERAHQAVKRRTHAEAVRALIARRLAERREVEWQPTKGIAG